MLNNSELTQYTKTYNKVRRVDEWTRINHDKVFWTGGKGASLNKGLSEANDVTVRVPCPASFKVGDLVVKGRLEQDITKQSDLDNSYTVNTVIENNYSKTGIDHIHIGAK